MDFETAPPPVSAAPLPLFPARRKANPRSGWYVGIVLGVLAGLVCLPPVRYTLGAQLTFAFAEESIPWMRTLDTHAAARETVRLDATANSDPGDYLMQIGRATVQPNEPEKAGTNHEKAAENETLFRLAHVVLNSPAIPGGYAHLARYMTASRVQIRRGEIDSRNQTALQPLPALPSEKLHETVTHRPTSLLPLNGDNPRAHLRDIQITEWALQTGERRDRENVFWPTMLAATYFSIGHDKEALLALQRASRKSEWDTYIHEEVLGQWRLYSAAYGDNGATQKIAPLSFISFPHLLEIHHTAEMARWCADHAANTGHPEEAIKIRRSIIWTGIKMRESAKWSLEALCGADMVLIGASDGAKDNRPVAIQSHKDWEKQSVKYMAFLEKRKMTHEIGWVRDEVDNSYQLRTKVDVARYNASYPGIPPGIPLMPLFGNWIIGVCLLQQMVTLSAAALIATLCLRRKKPFPPAVRPLVLFGSLVGIVVSAGLLITGIPTAQLATRLLISLTVLALLLLDSLGRLLAKRREERKNPKKPPCVMAESRWHSATTARMLALLLPPGMALLYWQRPTLSFLHPVAALLMSVMGVAHITTIPEVLALSALICGLTVAFVLLAAFWSLYRGVPPLAGVAVGLQRTIFPALACLALLYLGLLYQTLQLDAAASRGISEVEQNDLQWVLTHISPDPPAEE